VADHGHGLAARQAAQFLQSYGPAADAVNRLAAKPVATSSGSLISSAAAGSGL